MSLSIAHLGPPGTHAEQAALLYQNWLTKAAKTTVTLCPYPSIAQTLRAVFSGSVHLAVVPVENLIEGSVTVTLDTLWQLDNLQIQLALLMPIVQTLISCAQDLASITTVYSHPQALAQCQQWLDQFLPNAQSIATNSTTEALVLLEQDHTAAAIASQRAAQLYNLPILVPHINDYPDNCTRFWVVARNSSSDTDGSHTSLAFSLPANKPGALVKALQAFAHLGINLSRIESRPTKRSLGEYLFFIDAEANVTEPRMQAALAELSTDAELVKIFGSYNVVPTKALSAELSYQIVKDLA